jgi:hypothetical protein
MPKPSPDPGRRRVLARSRDVAAAGAALALFGPVAPAQTPAAAAAAAGPAEPRRGKTRGYRETEHTQRYYELARF